MAGAAAYTTRMSGFTWRDGRLHVDDVPLTAIAEAVGTPTYVYSASAIRAAYRRLASAFAPLGARFHYALKASPNLHLCRLLRELGAGMDVVSGGELERAWLAGAPMSEVVFAGVGKTDVEIRAALDGRFSPLRAAAEEFGVADPAGRGPVGLFNIESESELASIARLGAELGVRARACVRVNPNVDAHTHEYTSTGKEENKFGIDADRVAALFDAWAGHPGIDLQGLHVHLGSPVKTVEPYVAAVRVLLALIDELEARGHAIRIFDLGGGWPILDGESAEPGAPGSPQRTPPIEEYAAQLVPLLLPRTQAGLQVLLEPGRSLVAEAGVLLIRVEHVKRGRAKTFVICDGGMHSLIRPALYRAFHFVWPVAWDGPPPGRREGAAAAAAGLEVCDVVGPICETGDFLARARALPSVAQGDLLAVFSAGAYGMSMASNYNDHPRPAEVLVDGDRARVIHERVPLAVRLESERLPRELPVGAQIPDQLPARVPGA